MKPAQLFLADAPLKRLLHLFEATAPLHITALGDTQHPGSGYAEAALVAGVATVGELLAHAYDFGGLVYFEATIGPLAVRYHQERYAVSGDARQLARLRQRVRELNAWPGQPPLSVLTVPHR